TLAVAQDTGSAIKGLHRADIFCGTGDAAGSFAGNLSVPVRVLPLRPRRQAP
ncbi:MAG: 3D domain-containing protein, partial [Pseudomonadota bacterium]